MMPAPPVTKIVLVLTEQGLFVEEGVLLVAEELALALTREQKEAICLYLGGLTNVSDNRNVS